MPARSREIILGVSGGVAAYKSADLLRRLQDHGYDVTVIPTRASLNFVGKATWEALSGKSVSDNLWNNVEQVPHIALARSTAAIVIAPATADIIAKIAQGLADDLLTNVVSASSRPLIVVPAMHPEMWLSAANTENVKILRARGVLVIEPDTGRLTGDDNGPGRFPTAERIIEEMNGFLGHIADYRGLKVLISAGGTREPIDPVRYIGNSSSGKQGYALALAAVTRGAQVTLVAANIDKAVLPDIAGVRTVHVRSAEEMRSALIDLAPSQNLIVMAAAVSDVRVAHVSDSKIDKTNLETLSLVPNPDILAEISAHRLEMQVIFGFAAQTGGSALEKGKGKLQSKGLDGIYINDVSNGAIFGSDSTCGWFMAEEDKIRTIDPMSKDSLAHLLLDEARIKLGNHND